MTDQHDDSEAYYQKSAAARMQQGDNNQVNAGRPTSKEWVLLEKALMASINEQRRSRRWGVFFKLLLFVYGFIILAVAMSDSSWDAGVNVSAKHTAYIEVFGVIGSGMDSSAERLNPAIRRAFESDLTAAIVLYVNSPGGSPVHSGYIYDEIKRLRSLYPDKKVYAVISDIGASGAYYIASAADEIYADKASLVGSIGVIASGFGYVEAMEKLGVERRVYAAGEHKAFLDPFSPSKSNEKEFWQGVLSTVHDQFINKVKEGRGDRLKDDPEIFSGFVWPGEQAVDMGLIDGLGDMRYVAREVIGEESLVNYTPKDDAFERFAKRLGASLGQSIAAYLGNTIQVQ